MGHNYSKHFNKNNNDGRNGFKPDDSHDHVINVNEVPSNNHDELPLEETVIEEDANTVNYVNGIVSGCERLYVRENGTKESKDLCTITKNSEVKVDLTDTSSEDFYKVVTSSGIEGYCMKKFITIM